ncbi:MAG: DUF4238 domain-containing protein [Burkholderiales bacterium]|nr:DUF4238 domain-containing protein [Burkholderiales bacterium]
MIKNTNNKELRKTNHFVSKSYLKNWCGDDNKLYTYNTLVWNTKVPLWKKYSPSAVAYHSHLYTRLGNKGLDDAIERWFADDFESPAQRAIDRALKGSKLSRDDWNKLIRFVALHDARSPARLITHLENMPQDLSEILEDIAKEIQHPKFINSEPTNHGGIERHNPLPVKIIPVKENNETFLKIESYVGRSTWLYNLKYILTNTIKVLHKHRWTIVHPYKGMKWFTSDNPIVRLNFINFDKYDLKGGWDVKQGNILFPLSPEHLLFTEMGTRPPIKGSCFDKDKTVFIRKIIAENAYRKIFTIEPEPEILKYSPRIINEKLCKAEKNMWDTWHTKNLSMEEKYSNATFIPESDSNPLR